MQVLLFFPFYYFLKCKLRAVYIDKRDVSLISIVCPIIISISYASTSLPLENFKLFSIYSSWYGLQTFVPENLLVIYYIQPCNPLWDKEALQLFYKHEVAAEKDYGLKLCKCLDILHSAQEKIGFTIGKHEEARHHSAFSAN